MIKFILWCELIVPWFTLFFMDRSTIRRYMPVSIFVSLVMTVLYEVAYTYKWWVLPTYIAPWGYITHVSFVYGPYLIGTLWIFRLTYPHFLRYISMNVIVDGIFAFGILQWTQRVGIDKLVNMNQFGVFSLFVAVAVVIFLYQKWQEKIFKDDGHAVQNSGDNGEVLSREWFRRRERVR